MESLCKSIGYGLVTTARFRLYRLSNLSFAVNHVMPASYLNQSRHYAGIRKLPPPLPSLFSTVRLFKRQKTDAQPAQQSIADILEREIEDEQAELQQHLSTDQFPGFSVETDGAEVKLSKQVGTGTVTVRFNVSSSLNEWPIEPDEPVGDDQGKQPSEVENFNTELLSMPDFQVQVSKNNQTLEFSCYFEQPDADEGVNHSYNQEPVFNIDEIVLYENEPKETEFSVNAEYFHEDLQNSLLGYLSQHGIDDIFAKNLVQFATSYEKKQYIGLMERLKKFVSK